MRLTTLLLAVCALAACQPTNQDLADATRGGLNRIFATTPGLRDLDLKVGKVTLVTVESGKVYEGTATISRGEHTFEIPIHVTDDGEHVSVTPAHGAMRQLFDPDPK